MPPAVDPRVVLAVLAKRAPTSAIAVADLCLLSRERIAAERYSPDRERDELRNINAAAVDGLLAAEADEVRAIDAACAAALEQHDTDRRTRADERRQLRDAIDVDLLRESADPDEILRMVADARGFAGDVVGAEAARLAATRLRTLAREPRQHEPESAEAAARRQAAFAALCSLSSAPRGVERADVAARHERQKQALRQVVAEVANALGLSEQFRRAGLRAAAPQPAPTQRGTLTVGSWWDKHPQHVKHG